MACLNKYLQFPGSRKNLDNSNPRKVEDHITDIITSMKKQGKNFSAIHNYVSAICKYYRMNRVYLDTKHIRKNLPDFRNSKKGDGPHSSING